MDSIMYNIHRCQRIVCVLPRVPWSTTRPTDSEGDDSDFVPEEEDDEEFEQENQPPQPINLSGVFLEKVAFDTAVRKVQDRIEREVTPAVRQAISAQLHANGQGDVDHVIKAVSDSIEKKAKTVTDKDGEAVGAKGAANPERVRVEALSAKALKAELRQRGLNAKGPKEELQVHLLDHLLGE